MGKLTRITSRKELSSALTITASQILCGKVLGSSNNRAVGLQRANANPTQAASFSKVVVAEVGMSAGAIAVIKARFNISTKPVLCSYFY